MACFLLVHGAWHQGSCWRYLSPLLGHRGHQVLSPDLPGHGSHRQDLKRVSLRRYTDFLRQVILKLDKKLILVGHSMGGMLISQLAEQEPELIEKLVYIAAFLPQNRDSVFGLMEQNQEQAAQQLSPIVRQMRMSADKRLCDIEKSQIKNLFYNCCDKQHADWGLSQFSTQATLPLSAKVNLSEENFGRIPKVYISCTEDRVIPLNQQKKMISRQACQEWLQMKSDHSPFLSAPQTLADILDAVAQKSH